MSRFTAPTPEAAQRPRRLENEPRRPLWLERFFPRDYLPPDKAPLSRLVLGFAVAPIPALMLTMAAAMAIYVADGADLDHASVMTWDMATSLATTLYIAVFTGGVVFFLALWAGGLRGRTAYACAGVAVGLIDSLRLYHVEGAISYISVGYMICAAVLCMLTLRHFIGVRKLKARIEF